MGMRGTDRGYCHNKVLRDHCITMAICGMGIEAHSKQKKKLCESCNSCKYCDAPSECQTKDYHVKLGKNPAGQKKKIELYENNFGNNNDEDQANEEAAEHEVLEDLVCGESTEACELHSEELVDF